MKVWHKILVAPGVAIVFLIMLRAIGKVLSVEELSLLAGGGFNLISEDLGGSGHRNVVLDLWSGDVWVKRVQRVQPFDGV